MVRREASYKCLGGRQAAAPLNAKFGTRLSFEPDPLFRYDQQVNVPLWRREERRISQDISGCQILMLERTAGPWEMIPLSQRVALLNYKISLFQTSNDKKAKTHELVPTSVPTEVPGRGERLPELNPGSSNRLERNQTGETVVIDVRE